MKILYFLSIMLLFNTGQLFSQVAINEDGSAPDASAILDLASTEKGFLLPRLTQAQIDAIASPAEGLMVFNLSTGCFNYYFAGTWKSFCGTSDSEFQCGESITINHVAGNVAPVNKSVTYNTITNIPGEPAKCWITSNLGSDQQASSKSDITEASAGWYWQFNRKQGYKHDGITRTPNTTWNWDISESSAWTIGNDPCAIELGDGWRIPTAVEWTHVDASGSWTNWIGPWDSLLKLHAAGYIDWADGSLASRGTTGSYWSVAEGNPGAGQTLYFYSTSCTMSLYPKSMGYTIRCIRE